MLCNIITSSSYSKWGKRREKHISRSRFSSKTRQEKNVEIFNFSVKLCVKEKVFNSRFHNNKRVKASMILLFLLYYFVLPLSFVKKQQASSLCWTLLSQIVQYIGNNIEKKFNTIVDPWCFAVTYNIHFYWCINEW